MSRRVGHRQLEQLAGLLSERDRAILESSRSFRLMTVDQIRRIHFADHASLASSARVTRRVLARLTGYGLLARLDRRIGGIRAGSAGHVYTLAPLGHRLLGTATRKRRTEPTFGFVRHTLATTELATQLIEANAQGAIELLDLEPEPQAWRTHRVGLAEVTLKPDLYVRLNSGEYEFSWFIEIDCDTESSPTIQRKCHAYVDYRTTGVEQDARQVFPRVLWVAPDDKRAAQLEEAIGSDRQLPAAMFDVTTSSTALERLTGAHR